jgi:hypothetical protein
LFAKYLPHVLALTAPSSGRTPYHVSKPSAYRKVVTVVEFITPYCCIGFEQFALDFS